MAWKSTLSSDVITALPASEDLVSTLEVAFATRFSGAKQQGRKMREKKANYSCLKQKELSDVLADWFSFSLCIQKVPDPTLRWYWCSKLISSDMFGSLDCDTTEIFCRDSFPRKAEQQTQQGSQAVDGICLPLVINVKTGSRKAALAENEVFIALLMKRCFSP